MIKEVSLSLNAEEAFNIETIKKALIKKEGLKSNSVKDLRIKKKSIDARRENVKVNLVLEYSTSAFLPPLFTKANFKNSENGKKVIIVGSGPAGLFAALTLLEHGFSPLVLERGKSVKERKLDVALLSKEGILNENSNYCYGEGGAGTFSDGKLYTRSLKRGDVRKVLSLFIEHGAPESILYETRAHLGSDKLPLIITNIRNTIEKYGGSVLFSKKVTDLEEKNGKIIGVKCSDSSSYFGPVIVASGHSAEDMYKVLEKRGARLEEKETALGVRVEHEQALINEMQYHGKSNLYLPPAYYSFVTQIENRGVFSFCMCPGGSVIPSQTEYGYQVVNGMSNSSRSGEKANAAFVVEIKKSDSIEQSPYGILKLVKSIEKASFLSNFKAPMQRLVDFVNNKGSSTLPYTTYKRGGESMTLDSFLPAYVSSSLREAFKVFSFQTKGRFLTNDAVLIGTETRTSSPIRVKRDENFLVKDGLYVAGEGSGYSGGIVSSAIDGIECALSLVERENG